MPKLLPAATAMPHLPAFECAWANTELDHIISIINADDSRSMRVATKGGRDI
jgi:hypothetical protein